MSFEAPIFTVTTAPVDGRTVVALSGEMDIASSGEFRDALRAHLSRGPVVLDLSALQFIDSSGVHAFDAVLREAHAEGWTLTVAPEIGEGVRQVLQLTGLIDRLPRG